MRGAARGLALAAECITIEEGENVLRNRCAGFAGLILTLIIAGCGRKQAPAPPADAMPKADPAAVTLGKPNAAGPFRVTLSTPESPVRAGRVPFTADVTRDGRPVKDAAVKVRLSMPAMGMPGRSAALRWNGGRYAGSVEAGMAGDWQADVTVDGAGGSGHAAFVFKARE
jgi:hypothetical protein